MQTLADVTDAPAMEDWVLGCPAARPRHRQCRHFRRATAPPMPRPREDPRHPRDQYRRRLQYRFAAIAAMSKQPWAPQSHRAHRLHRRADRAAHHPHLFRRQGGARFLGIRHRPQPAKDGIALTLVRPGFIRTPMTANNPYKMPGMIDADQAAKIIISGIARGQTTITFPQWFAAFARLGNWMPKSMFAKVPGKPAQ